MAKDHPTGNSGLYRAFLQLKTPEECYRFLHLHRDHGQDRRVQRHHQPGQPGAERGR